MIFVTVGTHEQPFDRLIDAVDALVANKTIQEEVFVQYGYSKTPVYCGSSSMLPYDEMVRFMREARIVITHGGPSSFVMSLQNGKVPIVVPRQKKFGEHINDHQLEFCREVEKRQKNILVVEDTDRLGDILTNYAAYTEDIRTNGLGNNAAFVKNFEDIAYKLFS